MRYRSLALLSLLFGLSYLVSILLGSPRNLAGLSTVLGTTVMVTGTFVSAVDSIQLCLSLTCIGLLVFLELSDKSYGGTPELAVAIGKNLRPFVSLLVILFFLIVAFKVATILGI